MAVTAAAAMIVAAPLLMAGRWFATVDQPIVASNDGDDELVTVGGHTMLLKQGSVTRKIADWTKIEASDTRSFEVGDQSFAPNSAEPTPDGWAHLVHLAQIMLAHPSLTAQVLVPSHAANAAIVQVERMRARRLRDGLVAQGVPRWRVKERENSPQARPEAAQRPAAENPRLVVMLSK